MGKSPFCKLRVCLLPPNYRFPTPNTGENDICNNVESCVVILISHPNAGTHGICIPSISALEQQELTHPR